MFSKKATGYACLMVTMVVATNLLNSYVTFSIYTEKQKEYLSFLDSEKISEKNFEFSKTDGQIHGVVIMTDTLLTGSTEKDLEMAKAFLLKSNWEYVTAIKIAKDGFAKKLPKEAVTIFVFRALARDERIVKN